MAREASGTLELRFHGEERLTGRGIGSDTGRLPHNLDIVSNFQNGTSDGQIDRIYSTAAGSVVAASPVTIDLVGTSLPDVLDTGLSVSFADLQTLILVNTTASGGGNLLVGGATHFVGLVADATDVIVIKPQGWIAIDLGATGLALTGGTSDEIKVDASSGTVTYKVLALGRSA